MEEDDSGILQLMASNYLVANPSKTECILLNNKDKEAPNQIRLGPLEIKESTSAKLLGITMDGLTMDNDQKWRDFL